MDVELLIQILEASVKKNGEQSLTNKWLLNILKLHNAELERIEEAEMSEAYRDAEWGG